MATPIKAVPILSGTIADEFVLNAEENELKPRREVSNEQRAVVAKMIRQLQEYKFPWEKA